MKYYTIQPPGNLANFVQFYWVLEGKASAYHPFIHRVLAHSKTVKDYRATKEFKK